MQFEVIPYVGVGPIRFGLMRAEIRRRLAVPVESFMKSPESEARTGPFDSLGVHVYYGPDDQCKAAEFWLSVPTFRGQPLLGKPYAELERWLLSIDPDARRDFGGLTSLLFGFGLYSPSASHDPQSPVKSVIVFERGYYDRIKSDH